MLKKFGMVSAGVTAALLAAAPLASACEKPCDDGHDKGHHKSWDHGKVDSADYNTKCVAKSGDVKDNKSEGLLAGVGPILDGNAGQIASCNSFLNHNFSDNDVNILSPLSL